MSEQKPRLVIGPANIALAPDFVLIDSYAKAVEYFGEHGAKRYRAMFEDPPPLSVIEVARFDEEKPPTPAKSRYEPEVEPEAE